LLSQDQIISTAQAQIGKDVSQISLSETFGLKPCKRTFDEVMLSYIIQDMFECTGADKLNQVEKDCLLGKLQDSYTSGCCD